MDIKNTAITAQVVIESLLTLLENENVDIASIKFKVGGADQEYESSEMRFQDLIDIAFKGLDEIEGDYVLVPKEPTSEMLDAGCKSITYSMTNAENSNRIYRAMVEAAENKENL